ncbi:MAG: anhydro-N-acetylmuramic acid kinase [Phycisphaerales bacterium]
MAADVRHVVGCMTGTSIDAIDAALVVVRSRGLGMTASAEGFVSRPLGGAGALAGRLRQLAEQAPMSAGDIAALSREFSLLHADVVREVRGSGPLDLVCVHGQTVFHKPPLSWQMVNGSVIAHEVKVPVVFDLRAADLAAGGQGAPITPIADLVLFGSTAEQRAVVNLGGFCNITLLPRLAEAASETDMDAARRAALPHVRGGDVCACNHVLDAIARRALGVPFDADGQAACSGTVHDEALDDLLGVFAAQRAAQRSLGTGDEVASWIGRQWRGGAGVSGPDLCATACEAIADAIVRHVAARGVEVGRLLLAGGGVKNRALVRAIGSAATCPAETTAKHGVQPEAREAVCFAVLGALCQDRVPITLAQVTGVQVPPVAGVWA